ncbi:MAG: LacI family transcriptional regulator [Clostridiales bacterium]|nr:LacI family transcriptional regulator [Clostridiales bacterium]
MTIKDVAADAGVSTATVSHVINKTRYVSDEVTGRVNDSIARLRYYPNLLVSGLRSKKSKTIGIVIPSITNETFAALTERVQRTFFQMDYNIILCDTSYDQVLEDRAIETLIMKQADAVVIVPVGGYTQKMQELQELKIPVILMDRSFSEIAVDTIRVDNYEGQYEIINYLVGMGHKRIGYIDRKQEQSHSRDQKRGYVDALKNNGIEPDPKWVVNTGGHDFNSGVEAVKALVSRTPEVTAIAAYYDVIAFGAIRGLIDMGYSVPGDYSVVGYDGMKFTEVTVPRLTTVLAPVDMMARNVCDLVLNKMDGLSGNGGQEQAEPVDVVIKPSLVIRESCGEPAPEARL